MLGRPRPGDWLEDEIADWRRQGIDVAVSLLEPSEETALGIELERDLCETASISFASFPIPDYDVPPGHDAVRRLVKDLLSHLEAGRNVGIHCRGGVGRSAVVVGCVLVAAGYSAESALSLISKARGVEVPETDAQRNFVVAFHAV